jgi:hypothetical protein
MRRISTWALFRLLLGLSFCMAMAEILPAQNRGIPTAITMNTNQRFEGYLSWVEGYSTKVVADSAGVCYVIDNGLYTSTNGTFFLKSPFR